MADKIILTFWRFVHLTVIIFLFLPIRLMGQNSIYAEANEPVINVWYGNEQYFGQIGQTQSWINILGNVSPEIQWEKVTYSVNEDAERPLTLGSDLHRLAKPGDFNIELSWEEVLVGENSLFITAYPETGEKYLKHVTLHVEKGNRWPLPYTVDFTEVQDLQRVVQVVDGNWRLTPEGVRTDQPYYDRVICMGDSTWTNYDVMTKMTLHNFIPPEEGPPTYNVTHFGLSLRWRGHTTDGLQPSRQWYPLGAQGEFLLKTDPDSSRWRILFNGFDNGRAPEYSEKRYSYQMGTPMNFRAQVSTLPDGSTRYRFKKWLLSDPEPFHWDVTGVEEPGNDYSSGSFCIVPHNSNVTIHQAVVRPLVLNEQSFSALPGPGMLHYSAPVGGVQGGSGHLFEEQTIPPENKLVGLQVNIGDPPLKVVKAIKFRVKDTDGIIYENVVGSPAGSWQREVVVKDDVELVGISGASGWWIDSIKFHFSDGTSTSAFGGGGGDTDFSLMLKKKNGNYDGRLRGVHGKYNSEGIVTLGFIFDPSH